jgi:hypothetical protein
MLGFLMRVGTSSPKMLNAAIVSPKETVTKKYLAEGT